MLQASNAARTRWLIREFRCKRGIGSQIRLGGRQISTLRLGQAAANSSDSGVIFIQPHLPLRNNPRQRHPHLGLIHFLDNHGAIGKPLPEREPPLVVGCFCGHDSILA